MSSRYNVLAVARCIAGLAILGCLHSRLLLSCEAKATCASVCSTCLCGSGERSSLVLASRIQLPRLKATLSSMSSKSEALGLPSLGAQRHFSRALAMSSRASARSMASSSCSATLQ